MLQAGKQAGYILLILACFLFSRHSFAIDSIELFIERLSMVQLITDTATSDPLLADLQLEKIALAVDLSSEAIQLTLDLSALQLPPPYNKITDVRISCPEFSLLDNQLSCAQGRLSFQGLFAQQQTTADLSLNYNRLNQNISLSLSNLNVAKGRFSISYKRTAGKWFSDIKVKQIDYQSVQKYVKHFFEQQNRAELFAQLQDAAGKLSFKARLQGNTDDNSDSSLNTLKASGQFNNVSYQYGDDLAENLSFDFTLAYKSESSKSDSAAIDVSINTPKGEILQNDLYIVFRGSELLRTAFRYNEKMVNISRFELAFGKNFRVSSKGKLLRRDDSFIPRLTSEISISNWADFDRYYLQNILSGTDYEGLQIEGGSSARIKNTGSNMDISVNFKAFSLNFNEELSLLNLNGNVFWNDFLQSKKPVADSQLSWQTLTLNELPLGAAQFNFIFHNAQLQLSRETEVPVFDGALHINSLKMTELFSGGDSDNSFTLTVDGHIRPISLSLLSSHFQWPLLDGTLSAMIPETTYNEKYLSVGGALMMHVFDGVIVVKDLKIVEPLKDYAQLYANIDLNNLSLNALTKTYNFGEIQGRVEGKLSGLELSAWQPVAFDAYIRTPKNDRSRHRISQRAIDNLSSLGGASGLLSRTFLSFFETFGYDKIGLSCKLKNNVCQMSGVEAKGNSYYIVKGGGIPRIDVMGFQNKVNWQVLTSRLKAIQQANEAVIE